jgi:cellobiose phosphorylase
MRYGYFDDENREYVITRPDTPLPWVNYLGADAYFGIISNTAGGYSWYRDARLRRITRYRYNNVPPDESGRYLYLRDDGSGEFWSPTWQPTRCELDDYECRHGLSYTKIGSTRQGVRAETLYFVPPGEALEIWRLRVCNERAVPVRLSVFSSGMPSWAPTVAGTVRWRLSAASRRTPSRMAGLRTGVITSGSPWPLVRSTK